MLPITLSDRSHLPIFGRAAEEKNLAYTNVLEVQKNGTLRERRKWRPLTARRYVHVWAIGIIPPLPRVPYMSALYRIRMRTDRQKRLKELALSTGTNHIKPKKEKNDMELRRIEENKVQQTTAEARSK